MQEADIGSDNGLAPEKRQVIFLNNGDLLSCRIHASLGLHESE